MGSIKVLQVVGYKNSGKTTLINQFVQLSKHLGFKVVTIKHHGHHSPIEMPEEHVDSVQHLNHGADCTLVFGEGMMQLHDQTLQENDALENMLTYAKVKNPDIILIEGFKNADFPKVVLSHNASDWEELLHLSHIELLVSEQLFDQEEVEAIPRHNRQEILDWYKNWLGECS